MLFASAPPCARALALLPWGVVDSAFGPRLRRQVSRHRAAFERFRGCVPFVAAAAVGWLPLSLALPVAAEAAGIEAGKEYTERMSVESPWTGISFTVPAGYRGGYDSGARAVLIGSEEASTLVGVYGFSEGDPESVGEAVVGLIESQGVRLVPVQLESREDGTLCGRYQAMTEDGPGSLVGLVRQGAGGNVVVVAALGPEGRGAELLKVADAVLAGVKWTEPSAKSWRDRLAGVRLDGGGANSNHSSGGAGGYGSYASGTEEWMEFCTDGSYSYRLSKESYMSIEGMSASSSDHDEHQGRWWLLSDIGGRAILILDAIDGREFRWSIEETDDGANVEGVPYRASGSTLCR